MGGDIEGDASLYPSSVDIDSGRAVGYVRTVYVSNTSSGKLYVPGASTTTLYGPQTR